LQSESGKLADALAASQEGVAIRQKLCDADPTSPWAQGELANNIISLGTVQRRAGRPSDVVALFRRAIALLEHLPTLTPRNHYNLACCHAQLATLASEGSSGITADQGAEETERAMTALRQAIATGFGGIANLRTDPAFDVLQSREDFKKLVEKLEAKAPKTGNWPRHRGRRSDSKLSTHLVRHLATSLHPLIPQQIGSIRVGS